MFRRQLWIITLAALAASPAAAGIPCGGDGPPCPPPPPVANPLPPSVVSYGFVTALTTGSHPNEHGQAFTIADPGKNYKEGVASATASTGSITYAGDGSGLASVTSTDYPEASVRGSVAGGAGDRGQTGYNVTLLYSVTLHASDIAHANAIAGLLNMSGAIATIAGHTTLSSYGNAYGAALIRTGSGIFDDYDTTARELYGFVGASGLLGRAEFGCDASDQTVLGTAGCGDHDFLLPVNFVRATSYDGGSNLDFIGNVSLRVGGLVFGNQFGGSDSFIDPTITLASGLGGGYSIELGVANGAGAVPEPALWGLMLAGFGTVGVHLRRRRAALA